MGVALSCCCTKETGGAQIEDANGETLKSVVFSSQQEEGVEFQPEEDVEEDDGSLSRSGSIKRHQTFFLVNSTNDSPSCGGHLAMVRKLSSSASTVGNSETSKKQATDDILTQVEQLVDRAYDILPAEMLFSQLEAMLGPESEKWGEVLHSPLFSRFLRKLTYFYQVGDACCKADDDWIEVYRGDNGMQTIHGCLDPNRSNVLHYRVRAQIPTRLSHFMAVANEVQLMRTWNSLVVNEPEVIGRRTAHFMMLNYQVSAMAGMYKVDVLNEVRRFSDVEGGILVEYVKPVDKNHPSYKEPAKGYKRMQSEMKTVLVACGANACVLIQIGKLKLPIAATKWLAKTVGQLAGKSIVGALVSNAMRTEEPGNPWQAAIDNDELGLYNRLEACMAAAPSEERRPPERGKPVPDFDLQPWFARRPYHGSPRHSDDPGAGTESMPMGD